MALKKTFFILIIPFYFLLNQGFFAKAEGLKYTCVIPTAGNSWVINNQELNSKLIGKRGIENWQEEDLMIRSYFKTVTSGRLEVGLLAKSNREASILVSVGEVSRIISIKNTEFDTLYIGSFEIAQPGYHFIEMRGLEKGDEFFADVQAVLIGGPAAEKVYFVKDDYYWGRRGPSVHLGFQVPDNVGEVVYFYSEITIPEDNDVIGSYFMANGFAQGYFGMQVNSATERRILFSVWSPYKTDNPNEIPSDQKITLLKKGDGVYTGEFGNEGSGGQSYLKFDWKTDVTYCYLLKAEPNGKGETDFTAWFFAPETGSWKLIASFRRPKTNVYLSRLYSFLENFYTETGHVSRKGFFSNQWVYTTNNQWYELTKIKFTADATARKESRLDYAGGVEGTKFYLKNCGFFNETTQIGSFFQRKSAGATPAIDFLALP